jgi:hypothetical protein
MKRSVLLPVIIALATTLKGYAQDSMQTLFHFSPVSHVGIYVAPEFQYGQLRNDNTGFAGGSVMIILNKKFAIGATGLQNTDRSFSPSGISPLYLHSRLGGLKIEYTVMPNRPVHISFPLLIGAGSANADSAYHYTGYDADSILQHTHFHNQNNNVFLVVQPGIVVETNLLRYVKLYAGAYYRFSIATDNLNTLPASTLQGFSVAVGLKVGFFDFPLNRKRNTVTR